ncbi:hypothetical protein [Microbacterium paraoxydans]|uniref:hypothetical protein n=1 Tax=Microbacterium paraoxydans TaxID=199592 RepID=UPI003013237C
MNIPGTTAPAQVQFQLQWVGDMVSAPAPVNQAMIMADMPTPPSTQPDSHIVTFGYVTPPMIYPGMTEGDVASLAEQPLPVMSAGRFLFTRGKLRELRDQIDQHLAQHEGA